MKKLIPFLLGVAVSAILFSGVHSCSPVYNEGNDPFDSINHDFLLVPVGDFIQDVARYHQTHAIKVQPELLALGGPNQLASRTCVYTLDTLKKFIEYIELYSRGMDQRLGIRFFYGVYPKDQYVAEAPYGNMHTLFMVPVFEDPATETYVEFDPEATAKNKYLADGLTKPYTLKAIAELNRNSPVFMLDATAVRWDNGWQIMAAGFMAPDEDLPMLNQGQLCPPNCPDDGFINFVDGMYPTGKPYGTNTSTLPLSAESTEGAGSL